MASDFYAPAQPRSVVTYSPNKFFVREGKRMAGQQQSFSVEFLTEKHRKRFEQLQNALFGTEEADLRTLFAFWLMKPFVAIHFCAIGNGARCGFSDGVAHYDFQ
jgi:hypothetical protein